MEVSPVCGELSTAPVVVVVLDFYDHFFLVFTYTYITALTGDGCAVPRFLRRRPSRPWMSVVPFAKRVLHGTPIAKALPRPGISSAPGSRHLQVRAGCGGKGLAQDGLSLATDRAARGSATARNCELRPSESKWQATPRARQPNRESRNRLQGRDHQYSAESSTRMRLDDLALLRAGQPACSRSAA